MKFKGGVTRRTGGKAGGSLNTPAVFEPLFFSRPSASLEIYISSLLSVYPASFKEPLVAILPLPYPRIPVILPFVPNPLRYRPSKNPQHLILRYTETILHLRRRLRFVGR